MEKYGTDWTTSDPVEIEMGAISYGGNWHFNEKPCGLGLFQHYKNLQTLLWPDDDHHRWSDLALRTMIENRVSVFLGPGDCVAPETRILNPITGQQPTIKELCDRKRRPTVMTLDGPKLAEVPYLKGRAELIRITCANGLSFVATARHVLLSSKGFVPVESLRIGEHLAAYDVNHPRSIEDISRNVHQPNASHCLSKVSGSTDRYSVCCRQYDAQPHLDEACDQSPSPLPSDVQQRRQDDCQDVLGNRRGHNPSSFQPCDRPSNSHFLNRTQTSGIFSLRHSLQETLSTGSGSFQHQKRFALKTFQTRPYPKQVSDSYRKHHYHASAYNPLIPQTRIVSIEYIGTGDYYDLHVPKAHHYFAEGFIHHNSNKTYSMVRFALTDWWCFPDNTLSLISSTEGRSLEIRIWGKIKELFNRARDLHPWLPGVVIESMRCITPDMIDESGERGRLLTKGLICVPCMQGGRYVGLGKFVGVKAGRLRHFGDEVSHMPDSFLQAYANWIGNPEFRGVMSGNPIDPVDSLGRAAEPIDGWDNFQVPEKTSTWRSKFLNAQAVNFVGTDSPNFDYPQKPKPRYPYMISQQKLDLLESTWGKESFEWFWQGVGVMRPGLTKFRVITRQMCEQHRAFERAVWAGSPRKRIYALDAAYSGEGGDRCVAGWIEFGLDKTGHEIIRVNPPKLVPVKLTLQKKAEDQIADWIKADMIDANIPFNDCFYDGRATLGTAFSRACGATVPNAVEFGGRASNRIVRHDLFVKERDGNTRLKLCHEQFSKFVTELWFMLRYVIECDQLREFPMEICIEASRRIYRKVSGTHGDRDELETKADMKERTGASPDYTDWLVTAIEGARQRGFALHRLGKQELTPHESWETQSESVFEEIVNQHMLTHA